MAKVYTTTYTTSRAPKVYHLRSTRTTTSGSYSSSGSEGAHKLERTAARFARRITSAHDAAMDAYLEGRDRSASARKDGALTDFPLNAARGLTAYMLSVAPAAMDLAESLNTPQYRRNVRRAMSALSFTPLAAHEEDYHDDSVLDDDDDDRFED